ncbi:MAG: hypothetical protein CVT83_06505 [Alphaproteobacteria bacterium HGW-Alphaproteobacteria-5]|nr:MAG: hypothetical protein CVT83_06505 [Alphaproteobacteria bacterium HGW-Alphaproteobacteria-5]
MKTDTRERQPEASKWLSALRCYLACILLANLLWEILQLPLYKIWTEGAPAEIAFAVVHCTAGDLMIALSSLAGGLVIAGDRAWPSRRFWQVALITIIAGAGYTIFSEWLNLVVRESWAYSDLMPVVPVLGTGLSPLMQWIVIPIGSFLTIRRFA